MIVVERACVCGQWRCSSLCACASRPIIAPDTMANPALSCAPPRVGRRWAQPSAGQLRGGYAHKADTHCASIAISKSCSNLPSRVKLRNVEAAAAPAAAAAAGRARTASESQLAATTTPSLTAGASSARRRHGGLADQRHVGLEMDRGDTPSFRRLARLTAHCAAGDESKKGRVVALGDAVAAKKPGATNQTDVGRTAGRRLSLATCQFGITADVRANVAEVKRQMREVRRSHTGLRTPLALTQSARASAALHAGCRPRS